MKDEKPAAEFGGSKDYSYKRIIGIYLAGCIFGILLIVTVFNGMIESHDRSLTNEICNLISEKMDTSIKYISKTAEEVSTILSCYNYNSMDEEYDQLKKSVNASDYISIGIVGTDGSIYAENSECAEFEKWGLTEKAVSCENVTISEPYRSGMTGQLVFTMFSPIIRNERRAGTVFITYPLDEIQNIANTESLKGETEIWLMDGYSDNMIRCSGSDSFLIGSWSNFKIDKSRIKNKGEYDLWQKSVRNGVKTGYVTYELDDVSYTQVFKSIDAMPGWNVVVRLPSRSLSNTMQIFRRAIVSFAGVIIIGTFILFIFTHKREEGEKKIFEHLSTYDPLTNILNRRAFETTASNFFRQNDSPDCSFMFFDVDFFKQVNDSYGHEAGDYILIEFASALNSVYGEKGFVSRYGGDEFVVLIKNSNRDEINELTKRFSEMVSGIRLESDPDFRLHFSAGMAACPDDAAELSVLMKCADDALYKVKEAGRNGWRWYQK